MDITLAGLLVGILAIAGAYYQVRNVVDMSAPITRDAYRNPGLSGPTGPATA
ncbi:hypothetical protein BH23CHL8_BH23CHL8_06520 [soil metagenome]